MIVLIHLTEYRIRDAECIQMRDRGPRVDVDVLSSRLLSRISIRIQRVPDARINGRPGESRLKSCTMITVDGRMLKYHRHRTDW